MDVVEQTIKDRMLGKIDDAAAERRVEIGAAVMRAISCNICGNILDARSAAVARFSDREGLAVICGGCHGKVRFGLQKQCNATGKTITVTTWQESYTIKSEGT